jgi:chromosome segregation ATPase
MTDKPNGQAPANTSHRLVALLHLLDDETHQYESAVHKLREKQDILIAGKPKLLGRIDQELMAISHKATQLEKKRMALMAELGHPNQTLTQLIETLEPKAASAFMAGKDRLLRAAQDAHRQNHDTQDLLNLSLQWIQDTVELISSVLNPEASSYTAQGSKSGAKSNPNATPNALQSTVNHSA